MHCKSDCGKGCGKLCPMTFGLALGITSAIVIFCWSMWLMYNGMPPGMEQLPVPTWGGTAYHAFWSFLRGFVVGFVFAGVYDLILCCCMKFCCRKKKCDQDVKSDVGSGNGDRA